MTRKRGFEIVSKYQDWEEPPKLPDRTTTHAAGYDFYAAKDMVLPSVWKLNFIKILHAILRKKKISEEKRTLANRILRPYLVPTGIKVYMPNDEFLMLANRSSSPLKRGIVLPNGVGIVDADYYNNSTNEGEIFFQLVNLSLMDQVIKKGDRLGQGIFMPYLVADGDQGGLHQRTGGFGSSGR